MSISPSTRWRMFVAKHRSALHQLADAWRYLVLGGVRRLDVAVDVLHPNPTPSLCTCYGPQRAGREAYDDHREGCPWVAARCEDCGGVGWCLGCGGDGLRPQIAESEHPDGCHSTSATMSPDCQGDGHYSCKTCTRKEQAP